jgi:HSP20 family protein
MAFVRWLEQNDYVRRINRWQREKDERWANRWGQMTPHASVYPPINIYDDGESFIARAEIPGVEPDKLDITVTGDTLTLRGERDVAEGGETCCYHRRERSAGEFKRAFTLPEQVDSSKVVAQTINGVLEILLPRAEQAKQRKVTVKAS